MYNTSLYYILKVTPDNRKILEIFFQDWADRICNQEVAYSDLQPNGRIRVDFKHEADAVAMKLRGIPDEFQKYLEIVN